MTAFYAEVEIGLHLILDASFELEARNAHQTLRDLAGQWYRIGQITSRRWVDIVSSADRTLARVLEALAVSA